jgi:hypothetical protein
MFGKHCAATKFLRRGVTVALAGALPWTLEGINH